MVAFAPCGTERFELGNHCCGAFRFFRQRKPYAAGHLQYFSITQLLGHRECRIAMLAGAKKFAGPALLQILLGDLKPVGRGDHGFDAREGLAGDFFARDQDAVRFRGSATDSATQLVQLCQAEAIGVLDDHHRGVGNVDAYFDFRRRHQNLNLVFSKLFHHRFFFFIFQTAMQQAHAKLREHRFREALVFRGGGFELLLRFFNHWIDHVGLPSGGDFAAGKLPDSRELAFVGPAGFDGRAPRRHFVDHRNFEVAVQRQRQGARNGRGGHDQHVGRGAFVHQFFSLQDAEAVLLVDDDQAEPLKRHWIFDQRVRAHHDLRLAAFHAGQRFVFHGLLAPTDDQFDAVAYTFENAAGGKIMLRREDFGGRHQRYLIAVLDGDGRGFQGDNGFATADVALEQAVHGVGFFQIAGDFHQHTLLRCRGFERQNPLQSLADFVFANAHGDPALVVRTVAPQRERQLVIEKILKNQANLRWAAELIQEFDIFVFGREMGLNHCVAAGREAIAFQNIRRQSVRNVALEIEEHAVNNAPQHARADSAERFVNRDDAADFGGIPSRAFEIAYQFHLRVDHFLAAKAIEILLHFSVQHDFLALLQFSFEISAVEEPRMDHAARVANRNMKNGFTRSRKPHGAAAGRDLSENGVNLTGTQLVDGSKADAIFVAEGKISQQIPNGQNAALLQNRSAVGADPTQKLHRVFEGDRQENFWRGAAARHFYIIARRQTLLRARNNTRSVRPAIPSDYFGAAGALP